MAKNTIGQFIAALRKANGMTQQEVADRLNVSNKAVSRWERDECAPDLSLIPALAEMFGVTCDELLKGERILEASPQEKKEPRVEKQLRSLVNRTLSDFKTFIWISLAVSVGGLVCMFGISYGFYRPVIGFAVMLLFEVCAFILAMLAVNKAKSVKNDNELFEEAGEALVVGFNNTVGSFSFVSFFAVMSVVLLSLPLIIFASDYVQSVISIISYFTVFFVGIVLILALVFLKCRKPYMEWLAGGQRTEKTRTPIANRVRIMSIVQIGLIILTCLILVFTSWFDKKPEAGLTLPDAGAVAALVCIITNIGCFVLFLIKNKGERKSFILPGVRNIILTGTILILENFHYTGIYYDDMSQPERYDVWEPRCFVYAVAFALLVFVIFALIDVLVKRKSK